MCEELIQDLPHMIWVEFQYPVQKIWSLSCSLNFETICNIEVHFVLYRPFDCSVQTVLNRYQIVETSFNFSVIGEDILGFQAQLEGHLYKH